MSLPTPRLDDRRFQDLVDEAKRLIPRYCPEWTDHNVADPGIALIELFAWMTELTLYRLNRLPEVLTVKFLELMGVGLYPGAAARADVTFWLSAPRREPVAVPAGTRVGTVRTEQEEAVVFVTEDDVAVVPPVLVACLAGTADGGYADRWDQLRMPGAAVACFPSVTPGDALYLGFEGPLAANVVRLDVTASIEGVGVDPTRPPWAWETWTGDGWEAGRVLGDSTAGLNRDGSLLVALPPRHHALALADRRAFWLRCRMVEAAPDQPAYEASPEVATLAAASLGATAPARHCRAAPAERLGRSDGSPGQVFRLRQAPVLPRSREERVQVRGPEGTTDWEEVATFARSGPGDHHVRWDPATGEIAFGPRVEYPDGRVRQHGAVPPPDAEVVVTGYRYGGGARGNVGAGTISVLKSAIPGVARVENIGSASGGVDPETVENAVRRGPMTLRTGERAVTADDYERLTLDASPDVARARCLPPEEPGGALRVLVVPRREMPPERMDLDALVPPPDLVATIGRHLDARRTLTTAVEVANPWYTGATVWAALHAVAGATPELVRDTALLALYRYLNPLVGGPDGRGWAFGRHLHVGEVYALLSGIDGVETVEDVALSVSHLRTGERTEAGQRIVLREDSLFASYNHQVTVR